MKKIMVISLIMIQLLIMASPAMAWTYQIKKGDSLYKISQRYGTDVNKLQEANELETSRILSGKHLWIPDTQPMQNSRGNNELYLLARLISGEARGESYQGQVAVGAVIMNRIASGEFPETIKGNVFKRGEFESVANGQIWKEVTDSALRAAKAALAGEDPTNGALYFYNPAKVHSKTNWIWSREVTGRIDQHLFAI